MPASPGVILVVDDNEMNRDVISRQIKRQGHEVMTASSGMQALEMLKAQPFDLILLDIMMPGMNGYEVLERLRADEALRRIPVVVVSAVDDLDSVVRCVELGAEDYLFKPINRTLLRARVDTCLEKRSLQEKEVGYLKEINRLKDEFLRMVSHDLKNPLFVIIGYLHILETGDYLTNEEGKEFLSEIGRSAARMQTLIEDLLDLNKIESGLAIKLEPVPMNSFLQLRLSEFTLLAQEKQIELVFDPGPETELFLDPNRMAQVLANLISNAIKYTPSGGSVELSTVVESDHMVITIADTGFGIPEDAISHLFEKFYRVNRAEHMRSEGTGLGLAIVQAIVEQHQGTIRVESQLGVGSVFTVSLPRMAQKLHPG